MLQLHTNSGIKIRIETSDGPIEFFVDKTMKDTGYKYFISAPKNCSISRVPRTDKILSEKKGGG